METVESGPLSDENSPGHHPGRGQPPREDKEQKVTVIYNGVHERIDFKFEETLGVLRQRAVDAYGNIPQPHTVSLFTEAGVELGPDRDQETIRQAGIEKNDKLLLRPSKVRGGLA
jgi:hypothetical protein